MWVAWFAGLAVADDVVLEDFTGPTGSWFVTEGVASLVEPALPWVGTALQCTPDVGTPQCSVFTSTRFALTHDTVRLQLSTDDPVGALGTFRLVSDFGAAFLPETVVGLPPAEWVSAEIDATAGCGEWYRVEVSSETSSNTWIDDLVSTGAVCTTLEDLDGDGLCPRGTDLDGDGTCTADGEPADPGITVDCNDQTPGARCLTLTVTPMVVGQRSTFTVTGARQGEKVTVFWSPTLGQTCPAQFSPTCLDLASPVALRKGNADVTGTFVAEWAVGPGAAGQTLNLQAAVVRFVSPSDLSEVVVSVVP